MKKALLVKPSDSYSYAIIPNLGLGYLAAWLRRDGFEAYILDCNKESIDAESFAAYLMRNEFHLVGFQVYTSNLYNTGEMTKITRRLMKDAIIVIGGPHPSGDPEHALDFLQEVDCAVVGEGELAIAELMKLSRSDMGNASVLSNINNIAFRDKEKGLTINKRIFIENLDEIPMPAWDLIDPRTYPISPHGTFARAYPVAPIITTRGCSCPCTFCAAFRIVGRKVRSRSAASVLDEITHLYREYKVREFHIEDDNFTFQKDYVMRIADGIMERGLDIRWACPNGIRIDKIDEEVLSRMEQSGCYSISFGIESGSNRVLRAMKKNLTIEEIEAKIVMIKKSSRMNVTGFFLIGYPGETEEDIRETLRFSRRLKIDKASFSPVMPLPGSEIYRGWKKKIGATPIDWKRFLYYQFIPFVSDVDEKKLKRYIKMAVWGFYIRPRIIIGILREIKTFHQVKVLLKRARTIFFLNR